MVALIIVLGFFLLIVAASFAGLGADSRDPEVSLFRAPHRPPLWPQGGVRARY